MPTAIRSASLAALFALLPLGACAPPEVDGDGDAAELTPESGCSAQTEVILWTARRDLHQVAKYLDPGAPCTHYYLSISLLAADKTHFHPNVADEIARVHALGPSFHAVAEFNWTAWSGWVAADGSRDWYQAGLEFRRRMAAAGFDLHPGNSDTWLIQEIPTALVSGPTKDAVRAHATAAAHGLWQGDGAVHKMGMTTRAEAGSHIDDPSVLPARKQALEELLSDDGFWKGIAPYVRWWTEELYEDPKDACVAGATVAARAHHENEFLFHLSNLAELGGSGTARAFFHRAFTPLETSAWNNTAYGDNVTPAGEWQRFVSLQVYATRAWAGAHPVPGRRIGFVWEPAPSTPSDQAATEEIAQRLAGALNDGYARGAQYACSPTGDWSGCQCALAGASFQEEWEQTFNGW